MSLKPASNSITVCGVSNIIVLCFGVEILRCLCLMYVCIVLVKFWYLSDRLLGNSCLLGVRYFLCPQL